MRRALLALLLALLTAIPGCLNTGTTMTGETPAPPLAPLPSVAFDGIQFETDKGTFFVLLYPEDAPKTVEFMKKLVDRGYYNGREFNRVIPGFVIQEVDKAGGATDQLETIPLEAGKRSMFSAGALGIARNEDPNSGGSEFFVMDFATSHLYGNYTVFGQVITGLDVVHAIARVQAVDVPSNPVTMDRVAVQAAKIRSASLTTIQVGTELASLLPRQVAPTVRADDGFRYTLEYPANFTVLRTYGDSLRLTFPNLTQMTWYAWARGENAKPHDPTALSVLVEGAGGAAVIPVVADAADPGILHWWWVPDEPGAYKVSLVKAGKALASVEIVVL